MEEVPNLDLFGNLFGNLFTKDDVFSMKAITIASPNPA
jgi:hypothetical protein